MPNRLIFDLLIFTDDATPPMYEGHLIDTEGKKLAQVSGNDIISVSCHLTDALSRETRRLWAADVKEGKNA